MNIGMLWYDNSSTIDIAEKILRAADYYQRKYGQKPNVCFVHPSMLGLSSSQQYPESFQAAGLKVELSKDVLPHHLWLGIN